VSKRAKKASENLKRSLSSDKFSQQRRGKETSALAERFDIVNEFPEELQRKKKPSKFSHFSQFAEEINVNLSFKSPLCVSYALGTRK
jgi:hypothetical protein